MQLHRIIDGNRYPNRRNNEKRRCFNWKPRRESFSRKVAKSLIALAPGSLKLEIIEIGELPMYNQDLDETPPIAWTAFRHRLNGFDGVLFVTPEYNRSVPAVLKNAIDVGSRPYGQSAWDGKPGAVVSVSPGPMGGIRREPPLETIAGISQCSSYAAT